MIQTILGDEGDVLFVMHTINENGNYVDWKSVGLIR